MSTLFSLVVLFTQFCFNICDIPSINHPNCSLSFHIQTIYQSHKIQTDFPIDLIGSYNLTCSIQNLTAYYNITPLEILVIGKYKIEKEDVKSMINFHTTQFTFSINQSSTIRLCVLSDDKHRICRQIHIGINRLYNFWNLPMKIFYICLPCLISAYYLLYALLHQWCKSQPKYKPSLTTNKFTQRNDTFENEKVHEDLFVEE